MFAKIFETEEHGQVLLKADTNGKGEPELRLYFKPGGIGVCSCALFFPDTEDGWEAQEKAFLQVNKHSIINTVSEVKVRMLNGEVKVEGEGA